MGTQDKNTSHTINVKMEKDRTLDLHIDKVKEIPSITVHTSDVEIKKKSVNHDKPLISANNVPWGMTEQDIEEWDERFEEEMERIGDMYCEDVLDDIVNWCNDFMS